LFTAKMTPASNNGDDERGVISDADRRELRGRLDQLGEKIDAATGRQTPETEPRGNAMGVAFRLAAEMIAGVVVGGLLGYGVDVWTNSAPAGLIVGLLFGAGVGIYNAVRAARSMQKT
jgi:ATP synthase protein I